MSGVSRITQAKKLERCDHCMHLRCRFALRTNGRRQEEHVHDEHEDGKAHWKRCTKDPKTCEVCLLVEKLKKDSKYPSLYFV